MPEQPPMPQQPETTVEEVVDEKGIVRTTTTTMPNGDQRILIRHITPEQVQAEQDAIQTQIDELSTRLETSKSTMGKLTINTIKE